MTDNEIIKALECCDSGSAHECDFCEFQGNECRAGIISKARDLVNRQKAEIERLTVELVGMRGACESYKMHYDNAQAEIERLKTAYETLKQEYDSMFSANRNLMAEVERLKNERIERIRELTRVVYDKEIAEAKSEAYKEFAERLKFIMYPTVKLEYEDIDGILKELTEKNDKE